MHTPLIDADQGRHHPARAVARPRLRPDAQLLRPAAGRPALRPLRQLPAARRRFCRSRCNRPVNSAARLIPFAAESSTALAQPLRRQVFLVIVDPDDPRLCRRSVMARASPTASTSGSLRPRPATMAATVVVYVNRNLETADAVAVTASRHPAHARARSARGAAMCCCRSSSGRDALLHNALMADAEGRPLAWARPPDPKVEGTARSGVAEERGDHRQDADQPDARPAGRHRARDRARLSDRRRQRRSSASSACRCISKRSSACWRRFRCRQARSSP